MLRSPVSLCHRRLTIALAHFVPFTPFGHLALAISRDNVSPTCVACRDKMMFPLLPLFPHPLATALSQDGLAKT